MNSSLRKLHGWQVEMLFDQQHDTMSWARAWHCSNSERRAALLEYSR